MKESQLAFSYSWSDLRRIRALAATVVIAQVAGALAGLLLTRFPDWLDSLWFGGAVATFTAYVLGLFIQARVRPGSITENLVMVRRLGLVALLISAVALAMPMFDWGHAR